MANLDNVIEEFSFIDYGSLFYRTKLYSCLSSSYQKMTVYLDFRKKYVTLQAVKEAE